MGMQIRLFLILQFCLISTVSYAVEGIYTSRNKDLTGYVSYVSSLTDNGQNKGDIGFTFTNNTKEPIDLSQIKYYAINKDDAIYALQVLDKSIVDSGENLILNPGSQAIIYCNIDSFKNNPTALFLEFKNGERYYFIEEDKPDLYSTWYLRLYKSIIDIFPSKGSIGSPISIFIVCVLIGLTRSFKKKV